MSASLASDAWLADIARRATGLQRPALERTSRVDEPAVRERWRRWLRFGGGNDWRVLRQRMRAEGLRPASVHQPRTLAALPDWCVTLRAIVAAAPDRARDALPPGAQDIALADVFAPCLTVARAHLAAIAPRLDADIALDEAWHGLEVGLLRRLAEIGGACVLEAFDARRGTAAVRTLTGHAADPSPGRAQYDAFVAALRADGLRELFTTWPVLARLVAVTVMHWVDRCQELRGRLGQDHAGLCERFFADQAPGPLVAVTDTLSDPHAGGRTVLVLHFAQGARLVYKPRPLDAEAAFADTLDWLNIRLAEVGLPMHRPAAAWRRADYGWMAWAQNAPLAEEEIADYHWRLGSLLATYRALGGADLHYENLVAAGAYPVLVDAECLMHPEPMLPDHVPLADSPVRPLLQTGALPFYSMEANGKAHNVAALARRPDAQGLAAPAFVNENTDAMALRRLPQPPVTAHHPHTADGAWVDSLAHRHSVAEGYRHTLTQILAARDELIDGAASPWRALPHAQGRYLVRNTWNYGLLLRAAVAPTALRDGVMFELSFEALYRALPMWPAGHRGLAPVERLALQDLDVPRIGYVANDATARGPQGEPLPGLAGRPPWQTLVARLRALDATQIHHETQALLRLLRPAVVPPPVGETPVERLHGAAAHLYAQAADAIGPAPLWYTLQQNGGGVTGAPAGPGLYDGLAGISVALAAAGRVLDDDALRLAARDTLALPREVLALSSGDTHRLAPAYGQGLAGLLHALHTTGRMLDDAELVQAARRHARAWVQSSGFQHRLQQDPARDLLGGNAGILLTLLALSRAPQADPALLAAAQACGDHLIATAHRDGAAWSWPGRRTPGLSGLSHGGAGFATALAALYRHTGHARHQEAALGAIVAENRLFHPERRNWRDLRGAGQIAPEQVQVCGCSWCHGAPGIALGRAAVLRLLGDAMDDPMREQLHQDLDTALDTLQQALARPAAIDDLCCGTAGRIDILLACGQWLGRDDLIAQARAAGTACLDRWQRGDDPVRYWFSPHAMTTGDLSLFKGLAGWVYLQARLIDPAGVPCVLLPYPCGA